MKSKILKKACMATSAVAVAAVMSVGTAHANAHMNEDGSASLKYLAGGISESSQSFCDVIDAAGSTSPKLLPGSLGTMFTLVNSSQAGQDALDELSGIYMMACNGTTDAQ